MTDEDIWFWIYCNVHSFKKDDVLPVKENVENMQIKELKFFPGMLYFTASLGVKVTVFS